jgi:hypothetical protein
VDNNQSLINAIFTLFSLLQDEDDVLQEMAQYQVFFTLFIALLIRNGRYSRQSVLLVYLSFTHLVPFSFLYIFIRNCTWCRASV